MVIGAWHGMIFKEFMGNLLVYGEKYRTSTARSETNPKISSQVIGLTVCTHWLAVP